MAKKSKNTRKPNTNFQLGFNRQQLITAAQRYGKTAKNAKRESTKRLEQYIINQIADKGTKVPVLSDKEKATISKNIEAWGISDGLKRLTYAVEKATGIRNEENYLRLTIRENFALFVDSPVTDAQIDELISRLPQMEQTQVDSDMIRISSYYHRLFSDYADELRQE